MTDASPSAGMMVPTKNFLLRILKVPPCECVVKNITDNPPLTSEIIAKNQKKVDIRTDLCIGRQFPIFVFL